MKLAMQNTKAPTKVMLLLCKLLSKHYIIDTCQKELVRVFNDQTDSIIKDYRTGRAIKYRLLQDFAGKVGVKCIAFVITKRFIWVSR